MSRDFSDPEPDHLLAALRLFEGADSDWSDEDLADMFLQQLDAPLAQDLFETLAVRVDAELAAIPAGQPRIRNFRDLFWHPAPPRPLLTLAKEFAKVSADHPIRALPRDLARVLYYLAIVSARSHGFDITKLDPTSFQSGLHWAIQLPWITEPARQLLRSALA